MSAPNAERDRYPSEWVGPKDPRELLQGACDDVWSAVRKAVGVEPLGEEMARIIGEERADEWVVRPKAKSVK
jgi:hypothetical protein